MSTSTRDLWPDDIAVTSVIPPVAILREQAALLGRKTGGLVEGEVTSSRVASPGTAREAFIYEFLVKAPALGDYRYNLLSVRHGFELYPLKILFHPAEDAVDVESEAHFLEALQSLFSRPETKRIIEALIAQIER